MSRTQLELPRARAERRCRRFRRRPSTPAGGISLSVPRTGRPECARPGPAVDRKSLQQRQRLKRVCHVRVAAQRARERERPFGAEYIAHALSLRLHSPHERRPQQAGRSLAFVGKPGRGRRSMIFTADKLLAAWGRVLHGEDLAQVIVDARGSSV